MDYLIVGLEFVFEVVERMLMNIIFIMEFFEQVKVLWLYLGCKLMVVEKYGFFGWLGWCGYLMLWFFEVFRKEYEVYQISKLVLVECVFDVLLECFFVLVV